MPKFKLEEFLLPHEHDGEGKKLETPKELDIEALRKWVYGLLTDNEEAQEARDTAITEKENERKAHELEELRRKNESDEQRREREQKERDAEFEKLRKEGTERRKLDVLTEAFEKEGITAAQAKKLAKRVQGDEKDWVADAKELVADGFKVGTARAEKEEEREEESDDLRGRPRARVRRSDGGVPEIQNDKGPKTVGDELTAAGIIPSGW